ncbi:ubiquitin carboxyl-terminal hydrolase 7 isoform X1 [Rhopalosiphum maidis]|uniref:ubiquitin carboxyl-terminal hydrolase 7 isoform X1 n=1 Tax=Rhopalosiphum maidis TaxID=43146 RepID=UPI000EFE7E2C|nr:ubiquitin carboxyl-terminal hydrolase 7 isoform X1 [Rhopalosiphum maidis]
MNHMVERDSQNDVPEGMDITEMLTNDGTPFVYGSGPDIPNINDLVEEPPETIPITDVEMEEDNARPEATFRFEIENFSKSKDQRLSPPCYVRDLPWKIMIMHRVSQDNRSAKPAQPSVGFFLQCNGESENTSWSVNASAELRVISQKEGISNVERKIQHLFYPKENDWGFSFFMSWEDITDEAKGFIKNDTVIFEVSVTADAPHGVSWDSKKHTGYVGLKNQGATCYMNSLLQALYFTNQLRKAVYKMPTESDDSNKSVALALQRVFHELQFYDKPVGTKKLTKSFGWETLDSFMQHDVQEFLRVLLDKLENKMKGTCVEGTIPKLFEGKMISYINCKNVDYSSKRTETFYDIQLNIKGKKNIYESFKDYIQVEILDGDNRYDAGEYGLQDAEKGVIFASFPPVFYLHLMRFQYDPVTDSSVKFNDRFEFYDKINLDQYLKTKEETPADYILHAVLVHSGDNHGGHYVVFINPKGDGKWCKFDDDVVSRCPKEEAIEHNFGGNDGDENMMPIKQCTNAYMLVYIRDSELKNVLQEVTINDIPKELVERLQDEKRIETIRRKERNDLHIYTNIQVFLEDCFDSYLGIDLFDLEQPTFRTVKVKKNNNLEEVHQLLAETFKYQSNQIRIWPLIASKHDSLRPLYLDGEANALKTIHDLHDSSSTTWNIWLELVEPGVSSLIPFDKNKMSLIFFKLFIPEERLLVYCGYYFANYEAPIDSLVNIMNKRAGFDEDTKLAIYKETNKNEIEKITKLDDPLCEIIQSSTYGEILIYQKEELIKTYPCVMDHFKNICSQVYITFCDKLIPNDPGFTLGLPMWMLYHDMLQAVAERVSVDQRKLQIYFSVNSGQKECPGEPIKNSYNGPIRDLITNNSYGKRYPKKFFYQEMHMSVDELESKKPVKIIWCGPKLKDEKEIILYLNKNDTSCTHFYEVLHDSVELSPEGSGKFRTLEIMSAKISKWFNPGIKMPDIATVFPAKYYRVEEVPKDELELSENELLVPVNHFSKEVYSTFGTPFLIKIIHEETLADVKERIVNKTGILDKELEKYKFAICQGVRANFIPDTHIMSLQDFKAPPTSQGQGQRPWLGMEHPNKTKRTRLNYLEKAIKIYN